MQEPETHAERLERLRNLPKPDSTEGKLSASQKRRLKRKAVKDKQADSEDKQALKVKRPGKRQRQQIKAEVFGAEAQPEPTEHEPAAKKQKPLGSDAVASEVHHKQELGRSHKGKGRSSVPEKQPLPAALPKNVKQGKSVQQRKQAAGQGLHGAVKGATGSKLNTKVAAGNAEVSGKRGTAAPRGAQAAGTQRPGRTKQKPKLIGN